MGILPGKFWNTKKDRPLILGAHWDTATNATGFNDNGSGVAVMLEVARVLTGATCFQPDYTVFFVAFDAEESGSYGSQELIRNMIIPYYVRNGVNIQVSMNLKSSGSLIMIHKVVKIFMISGSI